MLKAVGGALARWLGPPAARLLARTWRIEVLGSDRWSQALLGARPYVLLSWHEALLPVMWHHRGRGIAALVSEARDGEYLARFARSLGYRLIRGSSSRGGRRALLGAIRALREGTPVGVTPDGPRGPRRVVKPGALAAAERGGALIVPVHADSRPAWRAGSWDGFLVPPPFARVRVAYGEPFAVGAGGITREAAVARATGELEAAMRLAAWPNGAVTPTG
jgi:lysophospholipid acyltransferase (LPLAT)-like uncharacterized protein